MKNKKINAMLLLGAVAIGITSNAIAAQASPTTKKLCDLSTLKGHYTFFQSNSNSTSAGSNTFDGKGHAVAQITVKYSNPKAGEPERPPVDFDKQNFEYAVDNRGECLFSVRWDVRQLRDARRRARRQRAHSSRRRAPQQSLRQ